jgi:hypothetical protein
MLETRSFRWGKPEEMGGLPRGFEEFGRKGFRAVEVQI